MERKYSLLSLDQSFPNFTSTITLTATGIFSAFKLIDPTFYFPQKNANRNIG